MVRYYDILLDFDFKPDSVDRFIDELAFKMCFISENFGITFVSAKVRETGKGIHIYLKAHSVDELNPIDIVILQFALGSDFKRELFNYRRVRGYIENKKVPKGWNVLFKVKVKRDKGKVIYVSEEKETVLSKQIEKKLIKKYLEKLRGE